MEAELGRVIRSASGGGCDDPAHFPPDAAYTDPEAAVKFAAATGIDALAIAFGTAHGVYAVKPELDVGRVAAVREAVGLPLVMHGGSGVSPADYRRAIQNGIAKATKLAESGMLVKRPLLVFKDRVCIGFKEAEWRKALDLD